MKEMEWSISSRQFLKDYLTTVSYRVTSGACFEVLNQKCELYGIAYAMNFV